MDKGTKKVLSSILGWTVAIAGMSFIATHLTYKTKKLMEKHKTEYIGAPDLKILDGKMTPEALLAFGRLSNPRISPDGKYIMYGVSYTSIEENRQCSNLYICNSDGSGAHIVTKSGTSISNALWIDGGNKIAYIRNGQIWVAKVSESKDGPTLKDHRQISDVKDGISEFKLSPDGKALMYVSTIQSSFKKPSDLYSDLDKARAFSADDLMYRHWDHWVETVPHTFIVKTDLAEAKAESITLENSTDILSGEKEIYELPAEPFSGIEQLSWSPDGKFIAYSCKKQTGKEYAFSTDSEIYIYRVEDGTTVTINMKGGYDTNPVWSPDGKRICWLSMERDGYEADKQRLITASIDCSKGLPEISGIQDITDGFKYNAASPVWDEDSHTIYFNALSEGLQAIYKADADSHEVERLTSDSLWYDFDTPFHIEKTGKGISLLTSWCSLDFPTELVKVDIGKDGCKTEQISSVNTQLLAQLKKTTVEKRYVKTVDGKDMLTWVVYPPEFDKNKTYPSIVICLGGPQGTLSQGWSYRWNYRLMASQGYVVVLPNRRGTTAFGQDWTEQISGDYCGLNIQDHISAAKDIKKEKYIGKVAACGASYGGYSVYYLSGVHGNTFDAFIAHAGIFNEEHMYMTTEEMWFANWDNGGLHEFEMNRDHEMGPRGDGQTFGGIRQGGSPWSNLPKAKRHYENSPHKLVTKWHTPILITHGGMDFRVPVDEGMAAYNAAQMMGVPSRLIVFPDENHWILKPQNALYWHREYFRWLDRWCK